MLEVILKKDYRDIEAVDAAKKYIRKLPDKMQDI